MNETLVPILLFLQGLLCNQLIVFTSGWITQPVPHCPRLIKHDCKSNNNDKTKWNQRQPLFASISSSSTSSTNSTSDSSTKKVSQLPASFINKDYPNGMPTRVWLKRTFNFSDDELNTLANQWPQLFSETINYKSTLEERVDWYLCHEHLQINKSQLKTMIKVYPSFLSSRTNENIEPKIQYLRRQLNLSDQQLTKIIKNSPRMLGSSLEKIQNVIDWLHDYLELNDEQIQKVLIINGYVLTCCTSNLEAKATWFQRRFEIEPTRLGQLITKQSKFLTRKQEANGKKIEWLVSRLQFNSNDQLLKVCYRCPSIFTSTENTLEHKIQWLQTHLELNKDQLLHMIYTCPNILAMDLQNNIQPTVNFYTKLLHNDLKETRELLLKCPNLLTYSLTKRLQPRLEQAKEMGIKIDANCLRRMGMCTDEKWQISIDYQTRLL